MGHPYPSVGVIALLASLAGCAHEEAPLTVPRLSGGAATATTVTTATTASEWSAPTPGAASPDRARAIDAIIYSSNLSNEEMLRRLYPYLGGLGTKDGFEKQNAGGPAACSASGPATTSCIVPGSGLELIYDSVGVLRVMRRQARSFGGRSYAASPLTGPDFVLR